MNKILVSDIINLCDDIYMLNCKTKKIVLNIDGEVTVYLKNEILNELTINLQDNSILNLYKFNNRRESNLEVNIYQNNDSKLNYNESIVNEVDNTLIINNYINGNNNESKINVRNISDNGLSKVIINVKVEKDTKNNIALEDLKGINNGGLIHIEPNIDCLSEDVSANHLTTIGCLNKDSLNYLMSKGISLTVAKVILKKAFIYSNMNNYFKENCGGD